MTTLTPDLRAFVRPGLAGTIVAADAASRLQSARVWAARPLEGRDVVELYVVREGASRLVESVSRNGRAAANLIDVPTYRSRTFKGRCTLSETALDVRFLDECVRAMDVDFASVGLGPGAAERMLAHFASPREMVALALHVDSVFDQSPKPGAGARL
jgi:hypothetical protein